jgi:hypothetical protein
MRGFDAAEKQVANIADDRILIKQKNPSATLPKQFDFDPAQ